MDGQGMGAAVQPRGPGGPGAGEGHARSAPEGLLQPVHVPEPVADARPCHGRDRRQARHDRGGRGGWGRLVHLLSGGTGGLLGSGDCRGHRCPGPGGGAREVCPGEGVQCVRPGGRNGRPEAPGRGSGPGPDGERPDQHGEHQGLPGQSGQGPEAGRPARDHRL